MILNIKFTIELTAEMAYESMSFPKSLSDLTPDEKRRLDDRLQVLGSELAKGAARVATYDYERTLDSYTVDYTYPVKFTAEAKES